MSSDEQSNVNKAVTDFLGKFAEVLELQLIEAKGDLKNVTAKLMEGITQLNSEIETNKKQAEKSLEDTYLNPDQQTKELVDSIQDTVDQLIKQMDGAPTDQSSPAKAKEILDNRLRRFGGKFSKHMEAISTLDDDVSQVVFDIVGALSNDDVINQQLDHVVNMLNRLRATLSEISTRKDGQLSDQEFAKVKTELLTFTYQQYASEEEKQIFKKVFGELF